jgi:hypothetical protein
MKFSTPATAGLLLTTLQTAAAVTSPSFLYEKLEVTEWTLAWRTIASSSNGETLYASGGDSLFSSKDSGVTWTAAKFDCAWPRSSIAASDDGVNVYVACDGQIKYSRDSGDSWSEFNLIGWEEGSIHSVACSADGLSKLVYGIWRGNIFTSDDQGVSWTENVIGVGDKTWESITMSADGVNLVAATRMGSIWTSANSGANWALSDSVTDVKWDTVVASSNGVNLAACASNPEDNHPEDGFIWISADS